VDRERELKFSLLDPPPDDAMLVDAFRGSGYALEPHGERLQRDAYVDTPDFALRRAGVALRRRETESGRWATLKTLGLIHGAYHERDELELPLAADGAWPPPLLAHLAGLARVDPVTLAPRMLVETRRRAFELRRGGERVAELCLDEVSARTPGSPRQALFREAELEAAPGASAAQLEAIAERLARALTLTPCGVTKLQRAEALLALGAALE
jgi:triphosphatase